MSKGEGLIEDEEYEDPGDEVRGDPILDPNYSKRENRNRRRIEPKRPYQDLEENEILDKLESAKQSWKRAPQIPKKTKQRIPGIDLKLYYKNIITELEKELDFRQDDEEHDPNWVKRLRRE